MNCKWKKNVTPKTNQWMNFGQFWLSIESPCSWHQCSETVCTRDTIYRYCPGPVDWPHFQAKSGWVWVFGACGIRLSQFHKRPLKLSFLLGFVHEHWRLLQRGFDQVEISHQKLLSWGCKKTCSTVKSRIDIDQPTLCVCALCRAKTFSDWLWYLQRCYWHLLSHVKKSTTKEWRIIFWTL